jgi:hypothetical protein
LLCAFFAFVGGSHDGLFDLFNGIAKKSVFVRESALALFAEMDLIPLVNLK